MQLDHTKKTIIKVILYVIVTLGIIGILLLPVELSLYLVCEFLFIGCIMNMYMFITAMFKK